MAQGKASPKPDELDPARVLTRAQVTIVANRSACKSVVMRGSYKEAGFAKKPARAQPEQSPYQRTGRFSFFAEDFGRLKRWDLTWDANKADSEPPRNDRYALAGNVVLTVPIPGQGSLVQETEFDHLPSFDFYRDHWFGNQSLEYLLSAKQLKWLAKQDATGTIEMAHRISEKGYEFDYSLSIRPGSGYMLAEVSDYNGYPHIQCVWGQDAATQIWFPKSLKKESRAIYPSGLFFVTEMTFTTEEARFNEELPKDTFTFKGLGLEPGSVVTDRRVTPHERYVFLPAAGSAEAIVDGVVPVAVAERFQQRQASVKRWKQRILVGMFVLLGGVIVGCLYFRWFRRTSGVVPSGGK